MSAPSKEIMAFMESHGVDSDEIWQTHGASWVVKHRALERIASEKAIVFDRPAIIEVKAAEKIAVVCVFGQLGERSEWSFGEAAPYNNKNAYPFAMAEKRAKDRVILKLLNAHGTIYSESEADEFVSSAPIATLPKKDARGIYSKLQAEIDSATTREQLREWADGNKDRIKTLPEDWQDILRLKYEEMLADLRNKERAA